VKPGQAEVAHAGLDPRPAPALSSAAHSSSARLVIHAANKGEPSVWRRRWHRLAGGLIGRRRDRQRPALTLTIQDLEGLHVSTFEPASPWTQLRLPPGTYVVRASNGSEQRTYTLTLSAGTSFELHVDPLQPWRFLPLNSEPNP
jgi:hypothetical protein